MTLAQTLDIFKVLLGILGGGVLTLIAAVYVANRNAKTEREKAKAAKDGESDQAKATIEVALVNASDSLQVRLLARVAALETNQALLEKKLDDERQKRRDGEEDLHKNRLRIDDLEAQIRTLQRENAEKIITTKNYQDMIVEQDRTIHELQDQIKELTEKCNALAVTCGRLQKELDEERAIGHVETRRKV